MSEETLPEDLTEESSSVINMDDLIAEAIAAAEAAENDGEDVGPEPDDELDQGELTDDETDDSASDDEDEPDQDETSEVEDEPEAEEPAEPEPEPEPADPEPDLREELRRLQEARKADLELQTKLLDMLEQQRAAKAVPQTPPRETLPEEVARLALFGDASDQGAWSRLDPVTQQKATKLREEYANREVRLAQNPDLRYQEIRDHVLAEIRQAMAPVVQEREALTVQKIFDDVGYSSYSKEEQGAIQAHYNTLVPETGQLSLKDNAKLLKTAVKLFQADKKLASLEKEKSKVRAKGKQMKANAKAARSRSAPRSSSAPSGKRPRWTPGQDIAEFASKLEQEGLYD